MMCDIIWDIICDIIYDIIFTQKQKLSIVAASHIIQTAVGYQSLFSDNALPILTFVNIFITGNPLLFQQQSKLGNFSHGLRWYALTWLIVGKSRKKIEKAKDFVGPKKPANAFLLFCQHRRTAVAEDYLKVRADTSAPPPPLWKIDV